MEVTEISADGLKREYKIVVPASELDESIGKKLTELSQTVRLNGFRPGKIPMSVIHKRFGDTVRDEVIQQTIGESSRQALTDKGVRPALPPSVDVEDFKQGEALAFKIAIEILPDFEPMDVSTLELTRLKAEATDEAVDESIAKIAAQQKSYNEAKTNRKCRAGDLVVIDFEGSIDGEPFEGGKSEDFRLELGSSMFIPGFEEQVIGAKAGDHITVSVAFPDDYPGEEVRGKEARFEVDVKQLLEPEEIAIDDALATRLGLTDLAALRAAVRGQIEQEYTNASRTRLKRQVLDKLADSHDFVVPPGMVEREFDQIWRQIEDDMKRADLTWEESDEDEEESRVEYRDIAERRVRLGLILAEIGRRNNITVASDELNRAIMDQARRFPGQEQTVFDYFKNNPEALNELQAPIFEGKVIDFIAELAKVTEESATPEDLMREPEAEAKTKEAKPAKTKRKAKSADKAKSAKDE